MKKNKISRVILISFISITIISILVAGVFWVIDVIGFYQNEITSLRTEFVEQQKEQARSEVEDVVDYIEYHRSKAEASLKAQIKERLYTAYDIATHIYLVNRDKKDLSEIKELVKEALRPIRFNQARGYYFAVNMDGVEQLNPVYPDYEGDNLLELQDDRGNYTTKNELEVVKSQGEGFLIDFWRKPGEEKGMVFPKITFVKKFEPFDWYLGTGDYLNDFEEDIKSKILERISEIRFDQEGYIFVNQYDGKQLITNGKLVTEYRNLKTISGIDGELLLQKEREAADQIEGDYIEYDFVKMDEDKLSPKISYIKGIPDWEWIVGAGFYIDDLDEQIEILEDQKRKDINKNLLQILIIIFGLLVFSVIFARKLFTNLRRNFQVFERFFNISDSGSEKIDLKKLDYEEFLQLAELINNMIDSHIKDRNTIIESELKYKNLVENQGEGVIIGDLKEDLIFANPAASRIMGVPARDLENKNLRDFLSDEDVKRVQEETESRKLGVSSTYELNVNRPDGEQRDVMITATPLFDHKKKVIGSIGIFRDITEWNQAKKELEKNRHLLNLINKILRHDLTNYLAAIQSGLNLYSKKHDQEFLTETYKKIDSSIELIRKMKEFESIKYSDKELNPLDTDDVIRRLILLNPEITIEKQGSCTILANESIHSVFNNLITNSIHHGKTDRVIIDVEKRGDRCTIKLKDFGVGIPDKVKDRIFEEGFKSGKTAKSGLGLYIVKESLNIMGGSIEVTDNEPQGAIFIIQLPCI